MTWTTADHLILRRLTESLATGRITPEGREQLERLCEVLLDRQASAAPERIKVQRTRVRAQVAIHCRVVDGDGQHAVGHTFDVGLGGIGVVVDKAVRADVPARVTLRPPSSTADLVVSVLVKWQLPENGMWRVGLRYHDVPWSLRALLTRLVLDSASEDAVGGNA